MSTDIYNLALLVSCRDLLNKDKKDKSDPIAVFIDKDGEEIDRTETITDNLNPDFKKEISLHYDPSDAKLQALTIKVYDVDRVGLCNMAVLEESQLLGCLETTVDNIMKSENQTLTAQFEKKGSITVHAKRTVEKKNNICEPTPAPPPAPKPPKPQPFNSEDGIAPKNILEQYQPHLYHRVLSETYMSDCEKKFGAEVADLVKKIYSRRNMLDPWKEMPAEPFCDVWEETWSCHEVSRDLEGEGLVKELVSLLRTKKSKFEDPHFPPCASSLYVDPADEGKNEKVEQTHRKDKDPFLAKTTGIEWKRPDEIGNPKHKPVVFSKSISPDDVAQGHLGTCYLLAAIAGCAQGANDVLIKDLVIEEGVDVGLFGVKFFIAGRWRTIIIDDYFPCIKEYGYWQPRFARPKAHLDNANNEKELWPMIFEKAWAKLHLSFEATAGGNTADTEQYLSGGVSSIVLMSSGSNQDWKLASGLTMSDENQLFISAAVNPSLKEEELNGLYKGHAYSMLSVHEVGVGRFVKLRNPWGDCEWKGDYSDSSPKWTEELKKQLGYIKQEDGSFWMCWTDFQKFFFHMGVCDPRRMCKMYTDSVARVDGVLSQWVAGKNAGGWSFSKTFKYNPHFRLIVDGPEVIIGCFQPDMRAKQLLYPDSSWKEMHVYLIEDGNYNRANDVFPTHYDRCKFATFKVVPGKEYWVVPTARKPGQEGFFTLTACGHNCTLTPMKMDPPPADMVAAMARKAA